MRHRLTCEAMGLAVCLLALAPSSVAAQGATDASIIGLVTDASGAVLPGVTVTAASPVLQIREMTSVSDARGEYRLSSLPIGTYDISFNLDGFRPVKREGLRLTAGLTARIDIAMEIGSLEETVTVSGASPVVDVSSTTSTTALTRETLELIPSSRNGLDAIIAQSPGVRTTLDVGGNTTGGTPSFRVFGQNAEPWPVLEGLLISSPKSGATSGVYQDYATVEEVQVRTMGGDADVPVRGVQVTAILKSGGNAFHGTAWWSYTNGSMEAGNIDDELASQGITQGNPVITRWDISGDLGGRIVRDKLWFYGAARRRRNANAVLDCFQPDGSQCTTDQIQFFETVKLSYQVDKSNRLVGFYQYMDKPIEGGASRFNPWTSRTWRNQPGNAAKLSWDRTLGSTAVANLLFGYWDWGGLAGSQRTPDTTHVATLDINTLFRTGTTDSLGYPAHPGEHRYQYRGSLTWYKADLFHGNHDIKTGFDVFPIESRWWFDDRGEAGNYTLRFSRGAPLQVATWNSPVSPIERATYTGLYVRDNWTLGRRLTLSLGIRYAYDHLYIPEQSREASTFAPAASFSRVEFNTWNTFAPRLHAAYDVSGDGKTVVKGGWGRYVHIRGIDEAQYANQNARKINTYTWRDLNGDKLYQPGEANLALNGPDFVSQTSGNGGGVPGNGVPNPDEKPPIADELYASVEREIMANFAVRFSGIHTREHNVARLLNTLRPPNVYNIPITNPDPGPDGSVGTADDPGTSITYYDYPASLRGLANQVPSLVNDPNATRAWSSLELAATKRLSNRWQVMASYSATKINVPFVTNVGGGNDLIAITFDPNAEIFAADNNWEWSSLVSGVYQLPLGLVTSANYQLRSGLKWARTASFTRAGASIPSITLRTEPIGSRSLDNIHLVDFRVEKTIRLGAQKIDVRMDAFNLLNINTVTAVTQQSGGTFGRPSAIVPARNVQFGVTYSF